MAVEAGNTWTEAMQLEERERAALEIIGFICPDCSYRSDRPGICPTCVVPLFPVKVKRGEMLTD